MSRVISTPIVTKAKDGKWAVILASEPIPEVGHYQTNADAWRSADGKDPSRTERVAQWAFEQDCARGW
jgi:hypothetical protein